MNDWMNKSRDNEKAKEEKKKEKEWNGLDLDLWTKRLTQESGSDDLPEPGYKPGSAGSNTKSKVPEKESSTMDYQWPNTTAWKGNEEELKWSSMKWNGSWTLRYQFVPKFKNKNKNNKTRNKIKINNKK